MAGKVLITADTLISTFPAIALSFIYTICVRSTGAPATHIACPQPQIASNSGAVSQCELHHFSSSTTVQLQPGWAHGWSVLLSVTVCSPFSNKILLQNLAMTQNGSSLSANILQQDYPHYKDANSKPVVCQKDWSGEY